MSSKVFTFPNYLRTQLIIIKKLKKNIYHNVFVIGLSNVLMYKILLFFRFDKYIYIANNNQKLWIHIVSLILLKSSHFQSDGPSVYSWRWTTVTPYVWNMESPLFHLEELFNLHFFYYGRKPRLVGKSRGASHAFVYKVNRGPIHKTMGRRRVEDNSSASHQTRFFFFFVLGLNCVSLKFISRVFE